MELGTELLLRCLADSLSHEIVEKEEGHCLRVDHLTPESANLLSSEIAKRVGDGRCYVLTAKEQRALGPTELNTERSIELRNRKPQAFILLVPSGLTDSTASSLRNAFAAFDLDQFWLGTRKSLISKMPERRLVQRNSIQNNIYASDLASGQHFQLLLSDGEQRSVQT